MKVSDSREGLVADKRGANSRVSLSLQGARMTDRQRLEGYKLINLGITQLASVCPTCHHKYLSSLVLRLIHGFDYTLSIKHNYLFSLHTVLKSNRSFVR